MEQISAAQRELLLSAAQIERALDMAEKRADLLKRERTIHMGKMHDAGISWAEIGRTFGVTPQAAMYATGHAQRQSRPRVREDDQGKGARPDKAERSKRAS